LYFGESVEGLLEVLLSTGFGLKKPLSVFWPAAAVDADDVAEDLERFTDVAGAGCDLLRDRVFEGWS
jgi:hypothetical protein